MDTKWEWFCGVNSSYTDESLEWYARNNTCLMDGVAVLPHAAFLVLASTVLFVLGCCTKYRQINTKYLLVYPGHSLRWFTTVILLVLVLGSIGEAILTDETYQALAQPTQPHLYISSVVAFVAITMSLVFYHNMEYWQVPAMSVLLMIYWLFALGTEVFQLLDLEYYGNYAVDIVLFDLTMLKLVCYIVLILCETNLIRDKLFKCCSEDSKFPEDLKSPSMLYMHYNVNLASSAIFWWVNWLLSLGFKKHLELSDLGTIPKRHEAKHCHEHFKQFFLEETAKAKRKGKEASLLKVYVKVYGGRLITAAFIKLIGELIFFINPIAVGALTSYVTKLKYNVPDGQIPPAHRVTVTEFFDNGFVLVVVMFLASLSKCLCLQASYYIAISEGTNVRAACQAMVYEKSLRLSTAATTGGKMSMGQITNHMSVDPTAVLSLFQTFNNLWIVPIQLIVNLVLLYLQMGYSALIAACVFVVMSPIQFKIATNLGKLQKKLLVYADDRLKKTNELLQGIKLLKLYAWEDLYCKAIEIVRSKELHFLMRINISVMLTIILTLSTPTIVTVVAFGTYNALTGKPLTPEVTFASLSLFNTLTFPLMSLPMSLLYFVNGIVSTKRIQRFLAGLEVEGARGLNDDQIRNEPSTANSASLSVGFHKPDLVKITSSASELDDIEYKPSTTEKSSLLNGSSGRVDRQKRQSRKKTQQYGAASTQADSQPAQNGARTRMKKGVAIAIKHGSFLWDMDSSASVLSDINLEIPEGKLTIITGQVGTGKSSLISAMLGEMTTVSGTVQIRDENQVAFAAQKPWLLNTSLQENILFGESLNSKRYKRVIDACSLKPDIDIFPAGDQTEIGEKGINLSGGQKQRVSVARAMYSGRDIVILDDPFSALDVHVGRQLFEAGLIKILLNYKQTVVLITHQLQYLNRADFIVNMKDGKIAVQGTFQDIIAADPDMYSEYNKAIQQATESEAEAEQSGYESETTKEERLLIRRQVMAKEVSRQLSKDKGAVEKGTLVEKEELERGSVSYKVYMYFFKNAGLSIIICAFITAGMYTGLSIGTNFWLSAWSEASLKNDTDPDSLLGEYYGVYVAFSFGVIIIKGISTGLVVWGLYRAARRLHSNMLHNIIKVPLRFYDQTPIGRVLNRFSSDTQLIDLSINQTFNLLIDSFITVISAVIVNTIVMPIFIAFFVPIAICYYFMQVYFLASSRELHRLDSVSKSPVFAYFSESLGGLSTIRAFKAGGRFYKTVIERINANLAAFLYLQLVNRWLGIRLDLLGAIVVLVAGMTTLVGAITSGLDPSLVGLAVSYTLQVALFLNFLVRMAAEMEMLMNGVERVKYYTGIENEIYDGDDVPPGWPKQGAIKFQHLSARYAHDTDDVLRDITVEFKAGEKIGICGRTGAGKSSLSLALLRVIDIHQGSVLIDGVDIKNVPLIILRSKLSIIPQDPILFTGTIRRNLDPVGHAESDEDLWHALDIAQLKELVSNLNEGLDAKVTEGGENFSVGQRQLFCLARAFLRKSRILIMDEATASIDTETDRILQNVVSTAFADRTVLTIAHRIATIMNSDNILVLSEGKVAEYGTPIALMENEGGIFASFIQNKDD